MVALNKQRVEDREFRFGFGGFLWRGGGVFCFVFLGCVVLLVYFWLFFWVDCLVSCGFCWRFFLSVWLFLCNNYEIIKVIVVYSNHFTSTEAENIQDFQKLSKEKTPLCPDYLS